MPTIDLTKLRAVIRTQSDEQVFYMLDDALELLPPEDVLRIVRQYLPEALLAPAFAPVDERSLLEEVRAFDAAARAGEYYEDFFVNSKNCTMNSNGTRGFIADCCRLFDRCADAVEHPDPAELRAAFDILLDLLRYIDEAHGDVIFFADEGGAWAIGVDFRRVFPAWFRCLARSTSPDEYARRVVEVVDALEEHDREKHFASAAGSGGTEHAAAVVARAAQSRRRRR